MQEKQTAYLRQQIINHVRLFFSEDANAALDKTSIAFCSQDQLHAVKSGIYIPVDSDWNPKPKTTYTAVFNGITITLWNRLNNPDSSEWTPIPDSDNPIWYRHESGALCPAWDIFGNLSGLLTLREETVDSRRDIHARYVGEYSPRKEANLLEVPAFNEAVAVLVGAAVGLQKENYPHFELPDLVKPPVVVLSHDCDILRGNDLWTQSIRAFRIFLPLLKVKMPRFQNIWWVIRNYLTPKRFYYDEALGMQTLEQQFGFSSTYYLLNGSGGRFGNRSGNGIITELVSQIKDSCDIGIHYNFDTFDNHDALQAQADELESIIGQTAKAGRAHYLRLKPEKPHDSWQSIGITTDESIGYPDCIGYRCGIGGIFQLFDTDTGQASSVYEVPLIIMEDTLMNQYKDNPVRKFKKMLIHLKNIGGAISMVVHPGMLGNPEYPYCRDFYYQILLASHQLGAVSRTPQQMLSKLSNL